MVGYSEHAIRAKQKKSVWLKDKHWRKAPDGCILFNTQEIEAWVEGKPIFHNLNTNEPWISDSQIRKRYGRWMPDENPNAGNKITTLLLHIGHKESASV